ncbi:MAG: tRNA pseudouridine(13) synthase TruD [Methanocellales archaeon]|nr:tRNA pseudouridine(13) synthase TruD [Methanocellales archaeon]
MGLYVTKTPGVGGKIRQLMDDFYVEEISSRTEGKEGPYLIVELTKWDWDTHHVMRDLSRSLGISQKRFSWAGTKDKRAITKQKISIWDISEEELGNVNMPRVDLHAIGRSNKKVGLGDLLGNSFRIAIRNVDIPPDETEERIQSISEEIAQFGGVPNFFGIQRFGTLRSVTHLVGEAIIKGDFERAALTYIAKSFTSESEEIRSAREYVWKTHDFKVGLKLFPRHLRYERAMMNQLVSNPGDYIGAFRILSPGLKKMFVHAYQSYIFNKIISRRFQRGLPFSIATEGDIVCFVNKSGFPDISRIQSVNEDNLDGINNLILRKRAFVTAPLIGYESKFAKGEPGEIERSVIDEMEIDLNDFAIQKMPELASSGLRREILLSVQPTHEIDTDLNSSCTKVVLSFSLPKGCYATVVLREYMKNLL